MTGLIFLAMMVLIIWAEIKVFALIGAETGALFVIVAVFATAAIGLRLFRKAGASTMRRFRDAASGLCWKLPMAARSSWPPGCC